jgi:hypothetical protein
VDRAKLAALDAKDHTTAERLQDATAIDASRRQLMAEGTIVRHQLDQDAHVRGDRLLTDAPSCVTDRLARFRPETQLPSGATPPATSLST